jgi:hypothetical protein
VQRRKVLKDRSIRYLTDKLGLLATEKIDPNSYLSRTSTAHAEGSVVYTLDKVV